MFHLLAFGQAALDATAGDVQLVAIADQQYGRSNNNFQIPTDHKLLFAVAGGANLTRARINTGSLRARGFPQLWPFNTAVLPPSNHNVVDMTRYPLTLRKEEDLRVDVTNSAAGGTAALLAVTPQAVNFNINYPDVRAIRFTASVTAVAYGWSTAGSVTFQDTLEGGQYAVLGMGIQGAAVIAARLIMQGQFLRPGIPGKAALGDVEKELYYGQLGYWGEFNTYSPPQIETLETGAGASAPVGVLLVAKKS